MLPNVIKIVTYNAEFSVVRGLPIEGNLTCGRCVLWYIEIYASVSMNSYHLQNCFAHRHHDPFLRGTS